MAQTYANLQRKSAKLLKPADINLEKDGGASLI